jgi:hypothetical protein
MALLFGAVQVFDFNDSFSVSIQQYLSSNENDEQESAASV